MISELDLKEVKSRFDSYVAGFYTGDSEYDRHIELKDCHCRRVSLEILEIAKSLDLNSEDLILAEIIGLLHDIGRFEQFKRYETYVDSKSVDHGALGAKLLAEEAFLDFLTENDRSLAFFAISYHGKLEIPDGSSERNVFFTRMLRDADKLDIMRLVTDYYSSGNSDDNMTLQLDLPDLPDFSSQVVETLLSGRMALIRDLKTLNDFKLLQISWAYDLNFIRTCELYLEREYLSKIRSCLPDCGQVEEIHRLAVESLTHRVAGSYSEDLLQGYTI